MARWIYTYARGGVRDPDNNHVDPYHVFEAPVSFVVQMAQRAPRIGTNLRTVGEWREMVEDHTDQQVEGVYARLAEYHDDVDPLDEVDLEGEALRRYVRDFFGESDDDDGGEADAGAVIESALDELDIALEEDHYQQLGSAISPFRTVPSGKEAREQAARAILGACGRDVPGERSEGE
jgi:hypothetical protein